MWQSCISAILCLPPLGFMGAPSLPGAPLGLHVAAYFSHSSVNPPVQTAKRGVGHAFALFNANETEPVEQSLSVLQILGETLSIDVQDMLNRSSDRAYALNEYLALLDTQHKQAKETHSLLTQRKAQYAREQRIQRQVVQKSQREWREALRAQNSHRALSLQNQFAREHITFAQQESTRRILEEILDIYNESIEFANKRLKSIEKNREILLAGLTVIDVPGIDDLGILKKDVGSRWRRS